MSELEQANHDWQREVGARVPALAVLLQPSHEDRVARGYGHTLTEILQQPFLWIDTADRAVRDRDALKSIVHGGAGQEAVHAVMLTGSGSSLYAGECVAPILQAELGMPVKAVSGGDLLTHPRSAALPGRPLLVVSLARSGNSPESTGVSEYFFEHEPLCRQLFITCNAGGSLALRHKSDRRAHSLLLDDRTNDRSLVMTSSFTSMVLAGRFLACLDRTVQYRDAARRLSDAARRLILEHAEELAAAVRDDFGYALYLGAGCRFGAAREAGLKMMEMSAGRVRTMAETYMGLRHGPMAAIGNDTLIVCFLSAEPLARAYETDLLLELDRKNVGRRKIVVGESIPSELLREGDLAIDCPGVSALGDDEVTVIDVLAGQLLAFFRCLSVGLRPDAPSPEGVISRVVESFQLYRSSGAGILPKSSPT